MTGVMAAWILGAIMLTWTQGLGRQGGPTWPPPFVYIDLTIFMGICALIARANNTVGALLAWGFLLALLIRGEQAGQQSIVGQLADMVTQLGGQGSAPATWAGQAPGGGATPGTGITGAGGIGTPSQRSASSPQGGP